MISGVDELREKYKIRLFDLRKILKPEYRMRSVKKNSWFREAAERPIPSARPHICMPTWRNFSGRPYRCGLYEAQDVLVEIDDVDLICLERDLTWGARVKSRLQRMAHHYDESRMLIHASEGLKEIKLRRDYDLLIVIYNSFWDLHLINAIGQWKDYCKISVCWIDELWAASIPRYKRWLNALNQFDYVFTGSKGSVSALSQVLDRPCHWLPLGIDALRFSPFPDPPARVIDVYSIGRRYDGVHREILKAAERGKLFYVHDTIANTADVDIQDYQQHRNLLASIAKRSRYFIVAPAKMDDIHETRGQVEIGARYYEGAAAGTVMIGEAPDCEACKELFGWPEAIIQIEPDGSDIMNVLNELDSDPKRMAEIRRRNTKEALLRHDWAYRWTEMFRVAGVELSPRMAARERRLKDVADFAASLDGRDSTKILGPVGS
jgi:hypothetical protein